ncbi:MAG: NAD(P)H-quinone oxidoreductase [Pyrinomonadaceae bacterium]
MKAVKIISFGGVQGLQVVELPDAPKPTADRVRVRVRAAGLNRADILQRLGHYPAPPGYPQDIPGLEFAGEVESVGEDARAWKIGDRVFGITGGGAQAEYVTVPESALARIPDNLDWVQAASIPEVFMTAHDALFTQCDLQMGERVLIHAAGSGVGTAASQLVKAAGATAYGTSRTPEKLERAKEFGLSQSIAVGNDPAKFFEAVEEWTSGEGVNVVLDLVGAAYLKANLESLARKGRLIFVGTTSGAKPRLIIQSSCASGCASWERLCALARWKKRQPPRAFSPSTLCRCSQVDPCGRLSIQCSRWMRCARLTSALNRTRRSGKLF